MSSPFVDKAQLHARAGDGGAGCVSFRREAHTPKGGPDGGSGGDGGDVWLVADHNVSSLLAFRDTPHRRATDGAHGQGKRKDGRRGEDVVVQVPEGTIVSTLEGRQVADLVRSGDRWMAARGGVGGRGNASFHSQRRRAPTFAEQGEGGEEAWYGLELKLMADVALVGFPNAGKSTLVSVVSAARPKVADYPFTTLVPNLGVVRRGDTEYVVADVPGLIEGAAEGRGLGHEFLRHIERARALVVMVDLAAVDGRDPAEQARVLLDELGRYQPDLLERPRHVVGSRADVATLDWDGPRISAATGDGVEELVGRMAQMVAEARATVVVDEGFVVVRPELEGFSVETDADGGYTVLGRKVERTVHLNDVTTPDAVIYIHERLSRMGVLKALERAGARPGDRVRIGQHDFSFEP